MTRSELLALEFATLCAMAQPVYDGMTARYGWSAVRAERLPRRVLVELLVGRVGAIVGRELGQQSA